MKFKKLAALTLAGAMSLSLAACGNSGDQRQGHGQSHGQSKQFFHV